MLFPVRLQYHFHNTDASIFCCQEIPSTLNSMKKRKQIIFAVINLVLLLSLGLVLKISFQAAHFMITNPIDERQMITQSPLDHGLAYSDITLQTRDGLRLAAWYIPSQNGAAVILAHGYKSNRISMLEETNMLARHGYGVLLFDSRAHGESEGETIRFGAVEMADFEAAYQFLLAQPAVDPTRIGLLGSSNGGAMSILYAAQNPGIAALVADSAYASLEDEIAIGVQVYANLPAMPFAPIVRMFAELEANISAQDISPIAVIAAISPRPILIIQGGEDGNIPVESGQQLFDAALFPKELWYVPLSRHTTIDTDYPDEYEDRIISFFDQYLLGAVD